MSEREIIRKTGGINTMWGMELERFLKLFAFDPRAYPALFSLSRSGGHVFKTQRFIDLQRADEINAENNWHALGL